jgi:hypothetical protein
MGKKIKILIRDEHPGTYFRKPRKKFVGVKILKFFDADPDPGIFLNLDPGSGTEKNSDPE